MINNLQPRWPTLCMVTLKFQDCIHLLTLIFDRLTSKAYQREITALIKYVTMWATS